MEEVRQYFPEMSEQQVRAIAPTHIHRFVCGHYKKLVPPGQEYYLAPFSIKKGANIYGIIFGSAHLLGLEKFLRVCWALDGVSGEANYDIDDDMVRDGKTLFTELNISKKIDHFGEQLVSLLGTYRSNKELYKFTLEQGCLPTHAAAVLREMQKEGRLEVDPADTRKGSFYLSWKHYRRRVAKVRFRIGK